MDADGTISYSDTRTVDLSTPDQNKLSIWPNPASAFIDVSVPGITGENYTAEIFKCKWNAVANYAGGVTR